MPSESTPMIEKAIGIVSDGNGTLMATRTAYELDYDTGNPRVIERVDFASGKMSTPMTSSIRTAFAADSLDMTNFPSTIYSKRLYVGDKSLFVVSVEQYVTGGTVTITPVVYDNDDNIVALLPPKTFTQPYAFRRGSTDGPFVLPVQSWDILGAHYIGVHVTAMTGTSNEATIYGWMI